MAGLTITAHNLGEIGRAGAAGPSCTPIAEWTVLLEAPLCHSPPRPRQHSSMTVK